MASNGPVMTEDAFKVYLRYSATLLLLLSSSKGICGALFGFAMVAAIARTLMRFNYAPRYDLDDALLHFACICLIATTVVAYVLVPHAYMFAELDFRGRASLAIPVSELEKGIVLTTQLLDAFTILSWLVVYAAKFCVLSFFRALIDRVRSMIVFWRIVVIVTSIFGGLSLCEPFLACPRINVSSSELLSMMQTAFQD